MSTAAGKPGCAFARDLESFGSTAAVVTDAGRTVTYAELAGLADAFAARLGAQRRLLLIEAANALEPLAAYLGALRAGHPVILTAAGGDHSRLVEAFRPDARYALVGAEWRLTLTDAAGPELHPELAVLLSTSGTTGATKLVRLSGDAVEANARSIVEYLGITADDRAVTSLPFHYSYGLSVINSHLLAGATVLLTDKSVVEPAFWSFVEGQGATSLAGVPYTYELLERVHFRDRAPATIRTLTQAGGRLPPELVRRMAEWAKGRGVQFFVMYGQTEATARMAYLPPDVVLDRPEAIGRPIPGGEFRLIDEDGGALDGVEEAGELVYRGPNVMMGYATAADDLARGRDLDELHTGDLAVRSADGLYRITGRKSRFAKIFGLRISLDEVEARLGQLGVRGVVVSDDELIYVALTEDGDPAVVGRQLSTDYKIPASVFHVATWSELPTLPSGKVDYQSILRQSRARASGAPVEAPSSANPIDAAFAHAFPGKTIKADDSFVSLGGDSLNYVSMSLDLERILGFLPEDWEQLSLRDLTALQPLSEPRRWWSLRTLETEVVLRMLAILAVVVNHASDLVVGGGAEVLLILAGYNLARYQKARLREGRAFEFTLSFARRIILPYYLLLVLYLAAKQDFDVPSLLLVSNFFGRFSSLLEPFWFLEAIIQSLVIVSAITLLPPVRRAIAADPWRAGLAFLVAATVLKCAAFAIFQHDHLVNRTPDSTLLLIAVGWCVNEAVTRARRTLMTGVLLALAVLSVVGVPGLWQPYPQPSSYAHAVWLSASAVGMLWMRRIPVPSILHGLVGAVAAASFYIYLTHVAPLWLLYWKLGVKNLGVNLIAAVALGLATWWAADRFAEFASRRRAAAS
ncbi:MAG: AMP-binding protein [Phenylobacterium sp.]|uniref:AMP-binding protein n=1 Tax=Phenylobacterium sp. TaxID=1871053 RepID=UPI001A4E1CCA|nr:AMP-binding protein [Phenylobacterium sp.]MBL8772704.1 AMP-binding protein [Phenylobacterium sp.]